MKAVFIDNQVYLVMEKLEAQAVAAACNLAAFEWANGDTWAKKMSHILNRARDEIGSAVLRM